jgi:hypothetical protein
MRWKAIGFAFDPASMTRAVRSRYEAMTAVRHRQMLEQELGHLQGGVKFDLERLMDACPVPEPQYPVWQGRADIGPKGRAAARDWYAAHLTARGPVLQCEIETIVVDDRAIVADGYMSAVPPGGNVRNRGVPEADLEKEASAQRFGRATQELDG